MRLKAHERLPLLLLAAVVTAVPAYMATTVARQWWSSLLVIPWALVLTGVLTILLLTPRVLASSDPRLRALGTALPGATLAFVVHESRYLGKVLEVPQGLAGWAGFVQHVTVVLAGVLAFAWWARQVGSDRRWTAAGITVTLLVLGMIPLAALLPSLTAIGLQLAIIVHLSPLEVDVPEVGKALVLSAGAVLALLLLTLPLQGSLWPPRITMGASTFDLFLTLSLTAAAGIFIWHLLRHGVRWRGARS